MLSPEDSYEHVITLFIGNTDNREWEWREKLGFLGDKRFGKGVGSVLGEISEEDKQ